MLLVFTRDLSYVCHVTLVRAESPPGHGLDNLLGLQGSPCVFGSLGKIPVVAFRGLQFAISLAPVSPGLLRVVETIGERRRPGDPGDHNFWAAVAIQALDVGIGSKNTPYARVAPVLACAALPY